jgi:ABC-type branched-subunit amino acid transport system ATPase component
MTVALIDVRGVSLRFGGLLALNDVSLSFEEGGVAALIGPNGAGKTTLFNVMSGFLRPSAGSVLFRGKEIIGLRPHKVARHGLVRSFQDVRIFGELTVLENIQVAVEAASVPAGQAGQAPRAQPLRILERLDLAAQRNVIARDLSYAEQKFVAFGRMIASQAPVLLLDEPSSGLDATSLDRFVLLINELTSAGTTIIIVEHNLDIVRAVAQRIAFLHKGELLAYGPAEAIWKDDRLIEVYLGGGA